MLFVSVSFIVLMIISLAWLVFYYVQRFRYIHAKDRLSVSGHKQDCRDSQWQDSLIEASSVAALQRRLCSAAKRALSKIPTRRLKIDDPVRASDKSVGSRFALTSGAGPVRGASCRLVWARAGLPRTVSLRASVLLM